MLRPLKDVVRTGCCEQFEEETNRKIVVINVFAFVGVVLTLLFGVNAFFTHSWWMGMVLLGISAALSATRLFFDPKKDPNTQVVPVSILLSSLFVLMALLVITGGNDNTGVMWIYILPPVALLFAGLRGGLIIIGLFFLVLIILFFYPGDALLLTEYTLGYKVRFLVSLATTVLFCAVYENSRQRSIDRIQRLNDKFEHLAMHDALTSLPNRRFMQEQLDRESARASRNNNILSLILCDIDKFKRINDTYGHDCGDQVLVHIAALLASSVRKQDIVARWGGEEFLILLPDTNAADAAMLADIIREKISRSPVTHQSHEISVTASFGVSCMNGEASLDEVLSRTDKALYTAKRTGRNRVADAEDVISDTPLAPCGHRP